jgi:hypothetical protein
MAIKMVVRKETAATLVNATGGDFLKYRVVVEGPDPVFALVDSKTERVLMSNHDAATGGNTWERQWPRPADSIAASSSHTMGLSFPDAIKYTYVVEHHRNNAAVEVLIDIDYQSANFEPAFFQKLSVTTF